MPAAVWVRAAASIQRASPNATRAPVRTPEPTGRNASFDVDRLGQRNPLRRPERERFVGQGSNSAPEWCWTSMLVAKIGTATAARLVTAKCERCRAYLRTPHDRALVGTGSRPRGDALRLVTMTNRWPSAQNPTLPALHSAQSATRQGRRAGSRAALSTFAVNGPPGYDLSPTDATPSKPLSACDSIMASSRETATV